MRIRAGLLSLLLLFQVGCSAAPGGDVFAEQSFKDIAKSWDPKVLEGVAGPELYANTSKEKVAELLALFRQQIGPLQSSEPVKWKNTNVVNGDTTQHYSIAFVGEKAPAQATLTVKNSGGAWRVIGIHVNSNALVVKLSPSPSPVTTPSPKR